jgi:hypothetical protein
VLGARSWSASTNSSSRAIGRSGTQPTRNAAPAPPVRRASATARSKPASILRASSANTRPASVSVTTRLVRCSSNTPNSSSSLRIARDNGGCAMCNRSAARPK